MKLSSIYLIVFNWTKIEVQSFLILFEGDLTEDPEHPKIFWPSEKFSGPLVL